LYLFKEHTLHRIISPTAPQQAQARQVTDRFLVQYGRGEPVDQNGLPLPARQSRATPSLTESLVSVLGWLGGAIVLIGGILILVGHSSHRQTGDQTPPETCLRQATLYTEQIERVLKANPNRQQQQLLTRVHRWRQTIEALARRLNGWRQNSLLYQDLSDVPPLITSLEQQLASESDPALRAYLERILTRRRNQLTALEQWQTTIRRAEIQIETTVAVFGTIYSQLLTNQSTSHVADYSRLLAEIDEEVYSLQDHLEALKEVKSGIGDVTVQMGVEAQPLLGGSGPKTASRKRRGLAYYPDKR
jgi:hypothetical protein